jgi:hypothetical protein
LWLCGFAALRYPMPRVIGGDVQIVTDAQVIVTNVSFHKRDQCGIVGYVRCTGRPAFAEPAQPHSTDNTQLNQLKHPSTITAHFANPATLARTQYVAMPPCRCICPIQRSTTSKRPQQIAGAAVVGGVQKPALMRLLVIRAGAVAGSLLFGQLMIGR